MTDVPIMSSGDPSEHFTRDRVRVEQRAVGSERETGSPRPSTDGMSGTTRGLDSAEATEVLSAAHGTRLSDLIENQTNGRDHRDGVDAVQPYSDGTRLGTPVHATLAAPFATRIIARFPGADGLTGLPDGPQ